MGEEVVLSILAGGTVVLYGGNSVPGESERVCQKASAGRR